MKLSRFPYSSAGQWVSGTTVVAIIISTCGCGTSLSALGDGTEYGFLVNTDTSTDLIGGIRLADGNSVYIFGTFNSVGGIGEIRSVVLQNAAGQKATLHLESGLPSKAIGFDGAKLDISYREVTSARLTGEVTYTSADGAATQAMTFGIDLQKGAAELAALVQQLTGLQISTDPAPSTPDDTAKAARRASDSDVTARVSVEVVIIPVLVAISGFTVDLCMGQILDSMVHTATAAGQALYLAFLTPFILMGNIMRTAMGLPLVTIDYGRDGPILSIPRPS